MKIPFKVVHASKSMKCPCGCTEFDMVFNLKKIPAMLSKSGKEEIFPLAVFRCVECKKVFSPEYFDSQEKSKVDLSV